MTTDPDEVVEAFIDRDQSGGGYARNWDIANVIYSCPRLGGFEAGHLSVGTWPDEWDDDEDDLVRREPDEMIEQNASWRRDFLDNPKDFPVDEPTRRIWRAQLRAMDYELRRRRDTK